MSVNIKVKIRTKRIVLPQLKSVLKSREHEVGHENSVINTGVWDLRSILCVSRQVEVAKHHLQWSDLPTSSQEYRSRYRKQDCGQSPFLSRQVVVEGHQEHPRPAALQSASLPWITQRAGQDFKSSRQTEEEAHQKQPFLWQSSIPAILEHTALQVNAFSSSPLPPDLVTSAVFPSKIRYNNKVWVSTSDEFICRKLGQVAFQIGLVH